MIRLFLIGPALLLGLACGARSSLDAGDAIALGGGGQGPQGGGGPTTKTLSAPRGGP